MIAALCVDITGQNLDSIHSSMIEKKKILSKQIQIIFLLIEGREGVKWELGFAFFRSWEMGFCALGLGFTKQKQ